MSALSKILVVGSGAREHALALRLLESDSVGEVVVSPGNAGTRRAPRALAPKVLRNAAGEPVALAHAETPDLVVIGPEAPLTKGVVDELEKAGFLVFGPNRRAAELEGSKAFMKEFATRHGVPTAPYRIVRSPGELDAALGAFAQAPVVKADGLCAGKGVVVASSHDEARRVALAMLSGESFGDAGRTVVLEERLPGAEASVHAICDGERFFVLPAAQDHKRIGEGDTGANTGGMGAYAPAPLVDEAIAAAVAARVFVPTLRGMAAEGRPFRGALYAGLMISPDGEPWVIEFNTRFGDPETEVLMAVLEGDLGVALAAAAAGRLDTDALQLNARHALTTVLAAAGYPESPRVGDVIEGLDAVEDLPGVRVHHAGTRLDEAGRVVSSGGRVLAVTAHGSSLAEAHGRAYAAVARLRFSGMQFRRDIGARALGPVSA